MREEKGVDQKEDAYHAHENGYIGGGLVHIVIVALSQWGNFCQSLQGEDLRSRFISKLAEKNSSAKQISALSVTKRPRNIVKSTSKKTWRKDYQMPDILKTQIQ
jgi:hypothetical protein